MSDSTASTRKNLAFSTTHTRAHYRLTVAFLIVLALAVTALTLAWKNPTPFGSDGYWRIASLRSVSLVVIVLVVLAQSFATITFQTITNNRILTPSIMGFESLYVAIQTSVVFFMGTAGLQKLEGIPQFILQAVLMVALAGVLYGWLLTGKNGDMYTMLLVGIVLGGGLAAVSTFMQRLLDPGTFDILTAKLFGNISNAKTEYLPIVIPVILVCAGVIFWRCSTLNVLALGKDSATNLGINTTRVNIMFLLVMSVLMSMTTALVGPMTFLGFLIATLTYQLVDTYDHRYLFPVAVLLGYVILAGAYFVLRNIFYAEGAVTIIIELVGGCLFLYFILRKGRL